MISGKNEKQSFCVFIKDGTPARQAKTTKKFHKDCGIKLFGGRLGNTINLNVIKNLWSRMKQAQKSEQSTSKKLLKKVWRGFTPEYLENLYQIMPRRMQAVIDNSGLYAL